MSKMLLESDVEVEELGGVSESHTVLCDIMVNTQAWSKTRYVKISGDGSESRPV